MYRKILGEFWEAWRKGFWEDCLLHFGKKTEKSWILMAAFRVNTNDLGKTHKNILPQQCGQYFSTGWNACSVLPWSRKLHTYLLLKLCFTTCKMYVSVNDLTHNLSHRDNKNKQEVSKCVFPLTLKKKRRSCINSISLLISWFLYKILMESQNYVFICFQLDF